MRALSGGDLSEVMEVQRSVYPEALIESESSFARKLEIWPEGAMGAFEHGALAGYLFCHPWQAGTAAPFDSAEIVLPSLEADLFIHDLAVRPERRGGGIASLLVREALALAAAHRFPRCALVAVLDARTFWERIGFRAVREIGYGAGVKGWYMVRGTAKDRRSLGRSVTSSSEFGTAGADDGRSRILPYSD